MSIYQTKEFYRNWDLNYDEKIQEKQIEQLKIAEQTYLKLGEIGIQINMNMIVKFGYEMMRKGLKSVCFLFVIQDNSVVNVNVIKKRKDIGRVINRYCGFKVITWYVHSKNFRYYVPNPDYKGSTRFTGHKRSTFKFELTNKKKKIIQS